MTPQQMPTPLELVSPAYAGASATAIEGDQNWAAWLARGHASELRMQLRITWLTWMIGVGLASWLSWALQTR